MSFIIDDVAVVRGGGDLATGVVQKLHRAGLRVLVLETAEPTAIRRTISLCRAVTDGIASVEDMTARLIENAADCGAVWASGEIPVLVDEHADCLDEIHPGCVVDAILAKRNLGTSKSMADVVIALGPGFEAGRDCHAVIETMRGHTLGTLILSGSAMPDTGEPGLIAGRAAERVLRAPCDGIIKNIHKIGDIVAEGDALFSVEGNVVIAPFSGVLRGIILDGTHVSRGLKTADVDPRADSDCYTITDKARCLGGAVLEAYLCLKRRLV